MAVSPSTLGANESENRYRWLAAELSRAAVQWILENG